MHELAGLDFGAGFAAMRPFRPFRSRIPKRSPFSETLPMTRSPLSVSMLFSRRLAVACASLAIVLVSAPLMARAEQPAAPARKPVLACPSDKMKASVVYQTRPSSQGAWTETTIICADPSVYDTEQGLRDLQDSLVKQDPKRIESVIIVNIIPLRK